MQSILVIAQSARDYAQALHLVGFKVMVIDGFADKDTRHIAEEWVKVTLTKDGFIGQEVIAAVKTLQACQALKGDKFIGFMYGSGFEAQPTLLNSIARLLPLIGNSADVVARIKNPDYFFGVLQNALILFPETKTKKHIFNQVANLDHPLSNSTPPKKNWLIKKVGGTGGQHIVFSHQDQHKFADIDNLPILNDQYKQAYLTGQPASLLFLADEAKAGLGEGSGVKVVSFNHQLLATSKETPFRFGGAVSHVRLSKSIQQQMLNAAAIISTAFNLKGLNSLDVIIKNNHVYVIEVNPRLSATLTLQDNMAELITAHLLAFGIKTEKCMPMQTLHFEKPPERRCESIAKVVVYASKPTQIKLNIQWPIWASDTPCFDNESAEASELILKDAPICSVYATGKTASMAKKAARLRASALLKQLN
jgi:predicted ATP-grasp superfamily ATP-dependent carboligase